jgi:hypothetical protein
VSSVGVFGFQFNGWYEEYIQEWFEACLVAQPDQIVLVSDRVRSVPAGVTLRVVEPPSQKYPIPYYANKAVEALDTEWCWNMDIDDLIRPSAFFEIRVVDAEVYVAGMRTSKGVNHIPKGLDWWRVWDSKHNHVPAGSAFKKWLWEKVGGYPDIGFHDWGLWRLMARERARFAVSGQVLYDYRTDHVSVSDGFDVELFTAEVMSL